MRRLMREGGAERGRPPSNCGVPNSPFQHYELSAYVANGVSLCKWRRSVRYRGDHLHHGMSIVSFPRSNLLGEFRKQTAPTADLLFTRQRAYTSVTVMRSI